MVELHSASKSSRVDRFDYQVAYEVAAKIGMLCGAKPTLFIIILLFSRGQKLRELNCQKIPQRSPYLRCYVVAFHASAIVISQLFTAVTVEPCRKQRIQGV